MPETIDAAVYNDLQRVIRVYGGCRPWTVGAMDGAAARGRLDILQRLHETRTEGCSSAAFFGAAANDHLEVLQWLYEFSPEVGRPADEAIAAAGNGHLRVVKWLAPRLIHDFGETALEAAAAHGQVDVVSYLLQQGTFFVGNDFVLAAGNGHLDVVKLCYSRERFLGYVVGLAMEDAVKNGHDQIVEYLVNKSEETWFLEDAVEFGRLNMLHLLLGRCETMNHQLFRILDKAVSKNYFEIVELLLSKIVRVDSKFVSSKAVTCGDRHFDEPKFVGFIFRETFISAVKSGCTSIVKMMLEKYGYGVGRLHIVGTALMTAAENNQVEVAKLLLNVEEASFSASFQCYIERAAQIVAQRHYTSWQSSL